MMNLIESSMFNLITALFVIEASSFLFLRTSLEPIQLVPKMIRRPTHLDHYLCRQMHNGIGIRSFAVTNLSGGLCRTYCRVMDRIGGKLYYTENISPNFVRCGPFQARCVDGNCVGFNYHPYNPVFSNGIGGAQSDQQNNDNIDSMVNIQEDDGKNQGNNGEIESAGLQSANNNQNQSEDDKAITAPPDNQVNIMVDATNRLLQPRIH